MKNSDDYYDGIRRAAAEVATFADRYPAEIWPDLTTKEKFDLHAVNPHWADRYAAEVLRVFAAKWSKELMRLPDKIKEEEDEP